MSRIINICLFVFTNLALCFGQEFNFDLYQFSLDSLVRYEKSIGSKLVENSSGSWNRKEIVRPITFYREYREIPNLKVKYSFYEEDSSLYGILYEWDISNFEKVDDNPQDSVFLHAMLTQFNKINNVIDSTFSSTETESSTIDFSEINSAKGYKRTNEWQPNDSLKIQNDIVLKNSFGKKENSTSPTVHKIKTYVRKVRPDLFRELSVKDISKLDSITTKFVETLVNDESNVYKYLSEEFIEKTTDEHISQWQSIFEDAKPLRKLATGIEVKYNYRNHFILLSGKSISMDEEVTIQITYNKNDKIIIIDLG